MSTRSASSRTSRVIATRIRVSASPSAASNRRRRSRRAGRSPRARPPAARARRSGGAPARGPPHRARLRRRRTRRPRPRSAARSRAAASWRRGAKASRSRSVLDEAAGGPCGRPLRLRADQLGEDLAAPAALAVLIGQRVVRRPGPARDLLAGVELLDGGSPEAALALELRGGPDREVEHLDGYQPRIGTSPVPPTEWLPSTTSASGWPRWITLRKGRQGLRGSLIGACAASRSVMRSANGRPSSGTGTKWRTNEPTTP